MSSRSFCYISETMPRHTSHSLYLMVAIRMTRKYGKRIPSVQELQDDFGMSRATAFRWRAALRDA